MTLTEEQQKVLAILPKISAPMSIFGSAFVLWECTCDIRKRRRRANHTHGAATASIQRALMGLSIFDILFSWAWFMSTWLAPEGTKVWSIGNQTTCNMQAFLTYVSIGIPLYSCVQSVFCLLLVRYRWTQRKFLHIEPWLHLFVWAFAFLGGTVVVATEYITADIPHIPFCANTDPPECYEVPEGQPPPEGCGRWMYSVFGLFLVPLWISTLISIGCMISLYLFVKATNERIRRYNFPLNASLDTNHMGRMSTGHGSIDDLEFEIETETPNKTTSGPTADSNGRSSTDNSPDGGSSCFRGGSRSFLVSFVRNSRQTSSQENTSSAQRGGHPRQQQRQSASLVAQKQVATRGILYVLAFLITWIWITIGLGLEITGNPKLGVWGCQAFLEPLQGFWNFLIFIQNRPESRTKLRKAFWWILTLGGLLPALWSSSCSARDAASSSDGLQEGNASESGDDDKPKANESNNQEQAVSIPSE